jgi:hypothetical protein
MKKTIEYLEAKIQTLEEAKSTLKNPIDLSYVDGKIDGLFHAIIQIKKGERE